MSTTPRTDARWRELDSLPITFAEVAERMRDFARQLETELNEAKSQHRLDLAEIRRQHQAEWNEHKNDEDLVAELTDIRAKLQAAEADAAQLASALNEDAVYMAFHGDDVPISLEAEYTAGSSSTVCASSCASFHKARKDALAAHENRIKPL